MMLLFTMTQNICTHPQTFVFEADIGTLLRTRDFWQQNLCWVLDVGLFDFMQICEENCKEIKWVPD